MRVSLIGHAPALADYLTRCGLQVETGTSGEVVLVIGPAALSERDEDALLALAVPVLFLQPTASTAVTDAAGLVPGALTPPHETRVRPGPDAAEVMHRSGGDLVLRVAWPVQDKVADDVQVLLTANLAFADHPVGTWRASTGVGMLTVVALDDPAWHRLVHRLVRHVLGVSDGAPVRVGILGYGAIGHEHSAAIRLTEGLELAAVCDGNPERIAAAQALAPDLHGHTDADALLADDSVDLVIVSTPPNTHAEWVLKALSAGKHVVVEKPFCLTVAEADLQIAAAREHGLTLTVYQNRRWDPDFLALKQVVRSGQIGEVFHYESFIGGYGHPCNYWHSDEVVSGGAIYDWGSHYLDWVLDLFPQAVDWVSATSHKRVWHDVTNADHTRVLVHFTDGVEAEFTHSDLSAALKPKFYVLGTQGGVIGDWRHERVVARSPIGTLLEDPLAHSDSPAELRVFTPNDHGRTHETRLAIPPAPEQPFHRQLADQVLSGEPMDVTPEGSRRNIAVMQAATESALRDGRPVPLPTG
ncbi:MAG: oxidoreductase domain protein [Frankiales bacterium]|nr:oxidoreductase domain protein [Frankiales bacterium]